MKNSPLVSLTKIHRVEENSQVQCSPKFTLARIMTNMHTPTGDFFFTPCKQRRFSVAFKVTHLHYVHAKFTASRLCIYNPNSLLSRTSLHSLNLLVTYGKRELTKSIKAPKHKSQSVGLCIELDNIGAEILPVQVVWRDMNIQYVHILYIQQLGNHGSAVE